MNNSRPYPVGSALRKLDWANRPSTGGEAQERDDVVIRTNAPTLAEGLIEGLRATLEAGMPAEELAVRVGRLIDLMVVEMRRPKGY